MLQQNPNVAVWQTADEYLGAAEILLDYNRLRPAAILAALSLELCLKCFLARRIAPWTATTSRGHSLVSLFNEISLDDRKALLQTSTTLDSSIDFEKNIERFDRHFENGRYLHEPDALNPIGSDITYFARHVHSAIHEIAKQRNV